MTDTQPPTDKPKSLSKAIIDEMMLDVKTTLLLLDHVKTTLNKEHPQPTEEEVEKQGAFVYHIDPGIQREYMDIIGKRMMIHEIIKIYYDWATRLSNLVDGNKNQLWNQKVLDHMWVSFTLVETIRPILKNNKLL